MNRLRRKLVLAGSLALPMLLGGRRGRASQPTRDGTDLIGSPAQPWEVREWIGSPPVSLADLRGKVVLVRWFTSPDCPYCHASAPALNRFHHDYARRGLAVIGMYHHKSDDPLTLDAVRGWVRDYGFQFPVGVDRDWRTLRRWWLDGAHRDFTSVSFLIDRRGVIRLIHPGGTLALGTPDFAAMQSKIEQLLAQ
jgi:peroxiredoxin